MKKRILLIIGILFITNSLFAQKPQKIGYIDMQYILENVPEYMDAQQQLNQKANKWQQNLDVKQQELNTLKENLVNEKALLTRDLIEDRQEDIEIKEQEFTRLTKAYFGANGDLFLLRKQLAEPVQDRIYNAIQDISVKKKFDFIIDKSSDLILLYTNKKYDISDLVIKSITRTRKGEEVQGKRDKKKQDVQELSEEAKQKQSDRELKKATLKAKIQEQKDAKAKARAEAKQKVEERRLAKIKEREEALKLKNEEKE